MEVVTIIVCTHAVQSHCTHLEYSRMYRVTAHTRDAQGSIALHMSDVCVARRNVHGEGARA